MITSHLSMRFLYIPTISDGFVPWIMGFSIVFPSQERMGEAETVHDRCRKILAKLETGPGWDGFVWK